MSSYPNNDAFATSSGRGDDRRRHYAWTSQQQFEPAFGNSSYSELHWTDGSHRESHVPADLASNANPWPSTYFSDPSSVSVFEGGAWQGHHDDIPLDPLFRAPGGNVNGSEVNPFVGMELAPPVPEQAFPATLSAIPTFQSCPPPSNWTPPAGSPWQPTSWSHPVDTARQHSDHSSFIGSLATRPDMPPFQQAALPASGHRIMPTGGPPSIATASSVQPSTSGNPVPASPPIFQSRGERWDLLNTNTFQCLWTSRGRRCTALIAGNRRSVTNHLRDEHGFACDDQTVVCAWGDCTSGSMQRRNIPRHIIACHFGIKVTCEQCGMLLSRADANRKHQLACTGVRPPSVVEAAEEGEGSYF